MNKIRIIRLFAIIVLFLNTKNALPYAIVHASASALPEVDIYAYKANSAEEAIKLHKDFARYLKIPETTIAMMDKVQAITKPYATSLEATTGGWSIILQEGFEMAVGILKGGQEAFSKPIETALAELKRGDNDAYHPNVPRGNRGRFAEWKAPHDLYIIVTLPGNIMPLNATPKKVGKSSIMSVKVMETQDPNKPGNKVYTTIVSTLQNAEYLAAEKDTRDQGKIRENAKISGKIAYNGQ